MKSFFGGAALLMMGSVAYAQVCNPVCASEPKECCDVQPPVASETAVHPSGRCLDNGLVLEAANGPFDPTPFNVSINQGTLVGVFSVKPDATLRYASANGVVRCANAVIAPIDDEQLIISGEAVRLSKKSYVCTTSDPKAVFVCFQVRGRSPLPVPASCPGALRVTDVCVNGTVLP